MPPGRVRGDAREWYCYVAARDSGRASLREAVVRLRTFVNLRERIYAAGAEEVDLLAAPEQMVSTLRAVFSAVEADFAVAE